MRGYHWGMIVLFLVIGYLIGMYWPTPGQKLRATLGI
jgi:hypothetical protein